VSESKSRHRWAFCRAPSEPTLICAIGFGATARSFTLLLVFWRLTWLKQRTGYRDLRDGLTGHEESLRDATGGQQ
jgi:hypothetical protein